VTLSEEFEQLKIPRKKMLAIKFISGPLATGDQATVPLTGENVVVLGSSKNSPVAMQGDRIVDEQAEIKFEESGALMMRNLNLNCEEACGIYKRLFQEEEWSL